MHASDAAVSPLAAPKLFLAGARGSLKAPGQLRIEAPEEHGPFCADGRGANIEEVAHIASTILENIVEENAQDDGDTSLEKNPGELQ